MLLEIAIFFCLGILLGLIAGLLPGIHPNTIALMASTFMAAGFFPSALCFLTFMVSLGISNSVSSFVPAIFIGAPDESSALAALPGHRLLRQGLGYHAVKLAVIGSVGALIFCSLLLPFSMFAFPVIYEALHPNLWWILSAVVIYMILLERKKIGASFCFAAAGAIGMLGSQLSINQDYYLFPLLSGFFGIPLLVLSLKSREQFPLQKNREKFVSKISAVHSVIKGSLAGLMVGLLPGVGPSQAATIASAAGRGKENENFLITLGSVSAANTLFSFLALWLIGKPRSGVAVEIGRFVEIGFWEFALMVAVSLAACGVAAILTLKAAKAFSSFARAVNYQIMNLAVIGLIFGLVFYFTSFYGILVAIVATALGIYANLSGVNRSHLMGCLLLPSILFFAGV